METHYVAPPLTYRSVEASYEKPPETLKEKAERIALAHDIATSTFFNLIESESQWNPDAYNEDSGDRGIVQISEVYHPQVSDACAFDPDCALEWAAGHIADGYLHQWTVCNCVSTLKVRGHDLPPVKDIKPNSTAIVGAVAIFDYDGVFHIAEITALEVDGFHVVEGNYEACKITKRLVAWDDTALRGFYVAKSGG